MEEWRDISAAPKDGRQILVLQMEEDGQADNLCYGVVFFKEGRWRGQGQPDWFWHGNYAPTHWMPLPYPPKVEDGQS